MAMAMAMADDDEKRIAGEIARVLDECRISLAVHSRKIKELSALRSSAGGPFFRAFSRALTPLFDFPRRTVSSERSIRFVSSFAAHRDGRDTATSDAFLEEFLRFLLLAAASAHRAARFRACQIISEIIMRLPDDAEVSDELWDEVLDSMKQRVGDKVPAIRGFAIRALSRFANGGEDSDIVVLFLETLPGETNSEVRKSIVLSLPPSDMTSEAIITSTLDVSESLRKAAYLVLASRFPLPTLSIKQRSIILQRGLLDRSSSVLNECLKMLKDWLTKCCNGDPIVLLRFLDVETYESVGVLVMETLLKNGMVQEHQSIRQHLASSRTSEEGNGSGIELIEAEVALYWRTLCWHLQSKAQIKGTDAASAMGTEAAIYASEASDNNDLLEAILPATVSAFVDLVKLHLSAGPNHHFTARQLLLLGTMLDFSDLTNRKVASEFVNELLLTPLEFEVDEDGNKIVIGDGISLGGDKEWARAVAELAKKVHASVGEFEAVITGVIKVLAQPCRDRTADFINWMHCLAVTGLLLENINNIWSLKGTGIEPSELLHALLLAGAQQSHTDVQRVAVRCIGLYGLLENRLTGELVTQLRSSFVNGAASVRIMTGKSMLDLLAWHGPQELDKAIGIDISQSNNEKGFISINSLNLMEDTNVGLLDLLYYGLNADNNGELGDADEHESVHSVLAEGFAKILLLSENYPSISTSLHPLVLTRLIKLYFCDETKELQRLKQCLSIFFEHYPALSCIHKRCISTAFIPTVRSFWPGIYGNSSGSSLIVSKMRKRALLVARFMLQMIQVPLLSKESKEDESNKVNSESHSCSLQMSDDFDDGMEGIAIRIAAEVASFSEKKTSAGKSYMLALSRLATSIQFRASEQHSIKCMRNLLNTMSYLVTGDKDIIKEFNLMATRLKSLDKHPDEEISEDQLATIFGKLGLEWNPSITSATFPPTPAQRSARSAPARRQRVRREVSSSDDNDSAEDNAASVSVAPMTASRISGRSQRASKTAAISKMSTKLRTEFLSDNEEDEESDVTAAAEEEPSSE
ncbi:condensin complex subunit 3-like isoform X1 [Zingiber officinale]|uniref:condensin complex subunit 3-like isoform X1 n=1 Tax=Zingiber officinale TaxID=94328 RepID=UPI001C4D462D|nr:condensin complex subunit 3-like isoform X1 [Zingiber officinale]